MTTTDKNILHVYKYKYRDKYKHIHPDGIILNI